MGSVDLSVIICTLNRSQFVRKCLEALATQECSRPSIEVVVVDNGSTDDTRAVAESFTSNNLTIRYIYEGQRGLGHARNAGLHASTGRYLAYLDDDAVPSQGWCAAICETFEQLNTEGNAIVAALGGPIAPVFETKRPEWLTEELGALYTILNLGESVKAFPQGAHPFGANCAFRRDVLLRHPWNENINMCDEVELFSRLGKESYRWLYVPEMRVDHFLPASRLTINYILNRFFAEGIAQLRLRRDIWQKSQLCISASAKMPVAWALSVFGPRERRLLFRCKTKLYLGYWVGLLGLRKVASASVNAYRT